MNQLQSTTLSNQSVPSSDLLLATYIVTGSKHIFVSVCIDQTVGNGEYMIYATRQLGGTGSAYKGEVVSDIVPFWGTSVINISNILADNTDIIKIYVTTFGLDTTRFNAITRFYEDDTSANIWENATRTLTQTALEIASTVKGSEINIYNDTSISFSLTGLGSLSGYTEIYFTCKSNINVPDENSIFQISQTGGLLYLYQTSIPESTDGSLTVDDEGVGNITIKLAPTSAAMLPNISGLSYDVKLITATDANVLTSEKLNILQTITQAVS